MTLFRPEATATLRRWSEALIGVGISALGFYWAFFSGGLLHWIGYFLAIFGGLLAFMGIQRGRFRNAGDGPGVVGIVERRVSYFGPQTGGLVDLDNLSELALDMTGATPVWSLRAVGEQPLEIPLDARGAEALFDAFASLPDIRTEAMLREMQSGQRHRVVIWQKENQSVPQQWLH
jgi:hypothetical protein